MSALDTLSKIDLSIPARRLFDLRKQAIDLAGDTVIAAAELGDALKLVRDECANQAEFESLIATLAPVSEDPEHKITSDLARRTMAIARKVKESRGLPIDPAEVRQLMLLTDIVPAPTPRNPEPVVAIESATIWFDRFETGVSKCNLEERAALIPRVEALLARLRLAART